MTILRKINNRHIVFLFVIVMILSFAIFEKSAKAQYWGFVYGLTPGDEIYSDILYNPSVGQIDLNGKSVIDAANSNFIIDPGGAYGFRINGSSTMESSSTWASEFDGNVEIHRGDLTINGAIIQTNSSTSILNFPGFTDTPAEYTKNDVSGGTSFGFSRLTRIIFDFNKIETSISGYFPVLFQGRYDMLKHRDWGGHVSSSVGADIAFSNQTDPHGTVDKFFKHELVHYNSTTGDIVAWFVPYLENDKDTTTYLFYGNIEEGLWEIPSDTWGTVIDYSGVYHFNDAQDAGETNDGIFNHTAATTSDVFISTTTFPFSSEYAQEFDGSSDYMTVTDGGDFQANDGMLVRAWFKVDSWPIVTQAFIMGKKDSYVLYHSATNLFWSVWTKGGIKRANTSLSGISTGEWHLVTAYYDKGHGVEIFIDGVSKDFVSVGSSNMDDNSNNFKVGGGVTGYSDFTGDLEEVRVLPTSEAKYGEGFDATIMNNYLESHTFYTVETSDVGKLVSVTSTEDGVEFNTNNEIYYDLIRSLWDQNYAFEVYFDTGNVLIGTGTPTGLLNLFSDPGINAQIDLKSGTTTGSDKWSIYNDELSNNLRFWNINQVSGINNMILTTSSNVGVGTNTVNDNLTLSGDAYFVQGNVANTLEVYNYAADGIAIYGEGFWAVDGIANLTLGVGVTGEVDGVGGTGVYGIGNIGVYGKNELGLLLGAGIEGRNSFYGGYFNSNDVNGAALYGRSDKTYAGILGENTRTDGGYGVKGEGRYGVYGIATLGAGIKGVATTSFSSYAGYFEGDLSLGRYDSGTPVYFDLYDDLSPPGSTDCDDASEYGRVMLETTNHKLYVCDDTGWKVMTLHLPSVCGDGVTEGEEACDDGDLVTEGCNNGIKETGTFCNSDCTLEYDLNEACDYTPQGNDCAPVPGSWTEKTGGITTYCKNDCSTLMFSCVAP